MFFLLDAFIFIKTLYTEHDSFDGGHETHFFISYTSLMEANFLLIML